ncbi:SGNH/GDSL hydrolase family protein [Paenibacillus sp. GCM10027626]|uniref:SGNH/GDSL hydrolase family protein n=1 Tax=Paenibacillus sp. GCM10027626 TaxID=3273411 RepID=UPI00363995E4
MLVLKLVPPRKQTFVKIIMITLLCCMVIATVLMVKWGSEKPPVKATWVWDTTTLMEDKSKMLAFAEEQGVNVIFLHIDREKDFEPYRAFVEEAHGLGIEVEALGGDPAWGLTDYQQEIESFIGWIEDYQRAAVERAAFDGVHVDIEPYLLKEWEQDRDDIVRQWMGNMEFLVQKVKQDVSLRVSADLPFWIHKIPARDYGSVGAWMIEQLDRVVLMNYRNFAVGENGIIANALPMIKEGTRAGKPVIIGLETAPTDEGEHTTFYGKGISSLNRQMQLSHFVMRWYSGYQGFSIHDYKSWKEASES